MSSAANIKLYKVKWLDIADTVARVNPELASQLNELSRTIALPYLYQAHYPFGDYILKNGQLCFTTADGQTLLKNDPRVSKDIQADLDYNNMPLCFLINKRAEICTQFQNDCFPFHTFQPGEWFGYWEWLDRHKAEYRERSWHVVAGSRSLFTLPKLANRTGLLRLARACGTSPLPPARTSHEQFEIFKTLSQTQKNTDWQCEVLIFPKSWLTLIENSLPLKYFLLKTEWDLSVYWRNQYMLRLLRADIGNAHLQDNLKPSKEQLMATHQILNIALGGSIGYSPLVVGDELSAPISWLQNLLMNEYQIDYYPTFLVPSYIHKTKANHYIYYSLQQCKEVDVQAGSPRPHSSLNDLRMVQNLIQNLIKSLDKSCSSFHEVLRHIRFSFFHYEPDALYNIRSSEYIYLEDTAMQIAESIELGFCSTANFFKGCVRIHYEK